MPLMHWQPKVRDTQLAWAKREPTMRTSGDEPDWGLGERLLVPKAVDVKLRKLVAKPSMAPGQARSIPADVGSTAPVYPIVPSRPKEHPQPISVTSGDVAPVTEPESDPTDPR